MTEVEFLKFFESLFDGLSEPIDMSTEFRYLDEWGSLAGLAFITDMEQKYQKKFTVEQFKSSETIGELYEIYKAL